MMKRKAFSLLEVLVTVFLFSVALGFSLLYTESAQLKTDLNTQALILATHLREAQSNASSGKEGLSFGLHFEQNQYVIYSGLVYDSLEASNTLVQLPEVLELRSLSLAGGGSEVQFDAPLGSTEQSGTLELHSTRLNSTLLFTITPLGQITYE